MKYRQTRFSDVCGALDEVKRLLHEEREKVFKSPENSLEPLLEDALFMLLRMSDRLQEYGSFIEEVRIYMEPIEKVKEVDLERAENSMKFMRSYIKSIKGPEEADLEKLDNVAELIRSVANDLEHKLRACKELSLKIYDCFLKVKGNRVWLLEEGENLTANLEKKYQAWLPPRPHKDKLLEYLVKSEARIIEAPQPIEQPIVQFEDGGLIPMSKARYNPDTDNFYPAGFKPSPSGRSYRSSG